MSTHTIWVDADACPNTVKETLFKAANRKEITLILVANHFIKVLPSKWISSIQVDPGFDVADDYIVEKAHKDDLVITSDIPLAAELIDKGTQVITACGNIFDKKISNKSSTCATLWIPFAATVIINPFNPFSH